jgi:hypothetical protein
MGANSSRWKRRRRRELFAEQQGKCYWCDRPCREVTKSRLPDDAATLDHLFDRFDPRRHMPPQGQKRYVMACHRCNHDRGTARQRASQAGQIQPDADL